VTEAHGGCGLVARTDRPAVIGHDQLPCTGINITRDDRVPACRSAQIMSRRARRRQTHGEHW
jgi:hypothetical protein